MVNQSHHFPAAGRARALGSLLSEFWSTGGSGMRGLREEAPEKTVFEGSFSSCPRFGRIRELKELLKGALVLGVE